MRASVKAVWAAALLAAVGCGKDVMYVPLAQFASAPLHGEFGYYDDGSAAPGAQAMGSAELDRHPDCSALNKEHTARFNGQRIEAASLGGLGPGGGDSGSNCGWPLFTVVESRTDALPGTLSDGGFELEDASHRMRLRVRDWVGPHGPELPEGTLEVTGLLRLRAARGAGVHGRARVWRLRPAALPAAHAPGARARALSPFS